MSEQAERPSPATIPFPASGRPVLWWPRRSQLLALLVAAAALLGFPPAAPAASSSGSTGSEHVVSASTGAEPTGSLPNDWTRPASGEVLRDFEAPPAPWAAGHRGIDLALEPGGEVLAPAHGTVSFSGVVVNREVLSVDHGNGLVSSFEPVESELEVGDAVNAGDVVASLGTYDDVSTHCESQPCLHWGVRLHGEYINPLLLTGELEPSVLLPLNPNG